MMPSHNAAATLSRAVASLLAQTFHDWECLFVDDGSTDGSAEWMRRVADSRIRCFSLPKNLGRGAARQFALQAARGKYLCMLDADDWYYPQKLEAQIERLEADPDLGLLSCGMAIIDRDHQLRGVRGRYRPGQLRSRNHRDAICFGPSMIHTACAQRTGFDPALRTAEDADFLERLLPGIRADCLPEVLYAYYEYQSATLAKVTESARAAATRRSARSSPSSPGRLAACSRLHLKTLAYRAVFALGLQDRMVRLRSESPTAADHAQFSAAFRSVEAALQSCFAFESAGTVDVKPA
jgi:glycosyltransferase involved in cell wall biosynthesis